MHLSLVSPLLNRFSRSIMGIDPPPEDRNLNNSFYFLLARGSTKRRKDISLSLSLSLSHSLAVFLFLSLPCLGKLQRATYSCVLRGIFVSVCLFVYPVFLSCVRNLKSSHGQCITFFQFLHTCNQISRGPGLNFHVVQLPLFLFYHSSGADLGGGGGGGALGAEAPSLLGYHLLQKSLYVFITTNLYPLCTC